MNVTVVINFKVVDESLELEEVHMGMPPKLSGLVCAYQSAAPGSSPRHTMYVFPIYSICAIFVM